MLELRAAAGVARATTNAIGIYLLVPRRIWDGMKRAFLFGLGTFLILSTILNIIGTLVEHDELNPTNVIGTLVLIPVSVIVIRAARRAPPNYSRLHAILGWLLGFLMVFAVIAAIGAIILIIWGGAYTQWKPSGP